MAKHTKSHGISDMHTKVMLNAFYTGHRDLTYPFTGGIKLELYDRQDRKIKDLTTGFVDGSGNKLVSAPLTCN